MTMSCDWQGSDMIVRGLVWEARQSDACRSGEISSHLIQFAYVFSIQYVFDVFSIFLQVLGNHPAKQ